MVFFFLRNYYFFIVVAIIFCDLVHNVETICDILTANNWKSFLKYE